MCLCADPIPVTVRYYTLWVCRNLIAGVISSSSAENMGVLFIFLASLRYILCQFE
jgi:hypothetical protein